MTGALVRDVMAALEQRYPPRLAEDWDSVGLAVGSRAAPVERVGFTVDVTRAVVAEAAAAGAQLLVAHHPPFLRGLPGVDLETPKGALVADLLQAGLAVYVAHTNADLPPDGTADVLAQRLGLTGTRPLQAQPAPAAAPALHTPLDTPLDKLVTFVPHADAEAVIDALAAAGAGQVGAYRRCAFSSVGQGTFTPQDGAQPYLGTVGAVERVPETRVEMVLPRGLRAEVVAALLAAHPYEVPAYDVLELAEVPGPEVGPGRVGTLAEPVPLGAFAGRVVDAVPRTPRGVLVAGDPGRSVRTVAVQAGAGDDLLDLARAAGADVYVTSDLRHHPAQDARAWADAPALIDLPHWAAEWLWLPVAAGVVRTATALDTYVSKICTDPWTRHLP